MFAVALNLPWQLESQIISKPIKWIVMWQAGAVETLLAESIRVSGADSWTEIVVEKTSLVVAEV